MARTQPLSASGHQGVRDALIPVELKTGHKQEPNPNHLAQLSIYTTMLRARHGTAPPTYHNGRDGSVDDDDEDLLLDKMEATGAADSGMLLYLNHRDVSAWHAKPTLGDTKTLIGQRNMVASDVRRASRPRGVAIVYEDSGEDAAGEGRAVLKDLPPSALPRLLPSASACERCYRNRECMMYASSDAANALDGSDGVPLPSRGLNKEHARLRQHFTGHLDGADLAYFRKWDTLIDLERHATARDVVSKSWLRESHEKERLDGQCISSLVIDETRLSTVAAMIANPSTALSDIPDEQVVVRFLRASDSPHCASLSSLSFEVGSYLIVSEDGTSFTPKARMYILRGSVVSIGEHSIEVNIPKKDIERLQRILKQSRSGSVTQEVTNFPKLFRLDKDKYGNSVGLLLQNLVNFFT